MLWFCSFSPFAATSEFRGELLKLQFGLRQKSSADEVMEFVDLEAEEEANKRFKYTLCHRAEMYTIITARRSTPTHCVVFGLNGTQLH